MVILGGVMSQIICNEQCDFVIRNYDACVALKDCYEQAIEKVPKWICRQLEYAIQHIDIGIKNPSVKSYNEKGSFGVNIFPDSQYYDHKEEVGLYFSIDAIEMIMRTDEYPDNGYPNINMYLDIPEKRRGKKRDNWDAYKASIRNNVASSINKLGDNNYSNSYRPDSENDNYIITTNISHLLKLDCLQDDHEKAILNTATECKKFISFVIENNLMEEIPK